LVIIEDLHWAVEATLDMVAFLGRRLPQIRALLLLTYRDDEVGPDHPLRSVLAGRPRGAGGRARPTPCGRGWPVCRGRRGGGSAWRRCRPRRWRSWRCARAGPPVRCTR